MTNSQTITFISDVLSNVPEDWINLTTHRLDIYDESQAKSQFLKRFEELFLVSKSSKEALNQLPSAYDYIRLGHPLSCVLEWYISRAIQLPADQVINFSSQTMPLYAVLRSNLLRQKKTQIAYAGNLPDSFDANILRTVYGYDFELISVESQNAIPSFDGSTIFVSQQNTDSNIDLSNKVDFYLNLFEHLGSVLIINGEENASYVSQIQHVRRRETIAMTPADTLLALDLLIRNSKVPASSFANTNNKSNVLKNLKEITNTNVDPLVASSGLSMQYAIMMGLVNDAQKNHPGKAIKFVVPPNCYGGTNDQARRVAASIDNVEIVDLPVDGNDDMVSSTERVLSQIALQDAIPYIIAEIPTNPRVEVPELNALKAVLEKKRTTSSGSIAVDPVFILDQTFCPNVHFLGNENILGGVRAIAYTSGSKFPSGGKCTAGFCVVNDQAAQLMESIDLHLQVCDNEATGLQYEILAKQLPSMNARIQSAYVNTRSFVNYIQEVLPEVNINFVSEELASEGFTPSVFSLDLPTKGSTPEEKEEHKRLLNHKLIKMMITRIPDESKHCVSYGQLKGCYWTIPATSTQGTTKESDKDYIVRVALSGDMDLDLHKQVFLDFVQNEIIS